jgi:small subunit ribosomal protein S11
MLCNTLKLSVNFTSNNIIARLVNNSNKTIACCSSGQLKFKGSTKNCLVAAETIAIFMAGKILNFKIHLASLVISTKGVSMFKTGFLKKLYSFNLPVDNISISQYIINSHNGCKLPKKRRK